MSSRTDRRLLWHPRLENRFIVGGGSQITLYEWSHHGRDVRQVTSRSDLQLMRCFAWSPHERFDDLLATGLSTGRVDLVRLEATRHARDNVLSSGPILSLPVRSSRACNALSFNSVNHNMLAVGLDKVRGDPSLIVWDVEVASAALHMPPTKYQDQASGVIVQQYAPTDNVSAVAFLSKSPNLLLAGVQRFLRLFDLRHSGTSAPQSVPCKVQGIAVDQFDQHRVASFGEGTVTLWDTRKLVQPVIAFTEKDASADGARQFSNSYSTVEFSSVRRGLLSTLEKDANHVRFWDIQHAHVVEQSHSPDDARNMTHSSKLSSRLSWAASSTILPWTTSAENSPIISEGSTSSNTMLTDTRRTKSFNRSLQSFAIIPSNHRHPLASEIVVVDSIGDLELYSLPDVPKHPAWSAHGDLAIGAGTAYRVMSGHDPSTPPPEPWEINIAAEDPDVAVPDKSVERRGREAARGQSRSNTEMHPGFGRGDQDGFSALKSPPRQSSLTATRNSRPRTFSPASIRRFPLDYGKTADSNDVRTRSTNGKSDSAVGRPSQDFSKEVPRIRKVSKRREGPLERVASGVLHDDISMIMRSRVRRGYGPANILHNANIITEVPSDVLALHDIWLWLDHCRQLLSYGSHKIHGFDFSYQGLLGIWEGLQVASPNDSGVNFEGPEIPVASEFPPSPLDANLDIPSPPRLRHARRSHSPTDSYHGDYITALNTLNSRRDVDKSTTKVTVTTSKLAHRRLALALCNWKIGEEVFQQWEREGKHSQVACWLYFLNQPSRAIDVLMRSKDENHQIMSGTLAALNVHSTGSASKLHELRDHCGRLIVKIQDPHCRILLSAMVIGDWSDILEEETLPLRERLAIALRFLDDKSLSSYLRRVTEDCRARGRIEGIVLTGLTPRGMDILQSYIDTTGDIQTVAILACFVCPTRLQDRRAERWLELYRDLLDGWKLFHHRCQFDIDFGKILQDAIQIGDIPPFEWVPRQLLVRCTYCNKVVNSQRPIDGGLSQRKRATACPSCGRSLPRCSICLMSVSIVSDPVRESDLLQSSPRDTIYDAFVFCQSCKHGGHASHIIDWFYGDDGGIHRPCPVADCDCRCGELM
ncbi:WD40 repeat-like protein [Rickenella mellea]|uniref:WD40 repeat-like protein n=1 Tax=Rickenella mellea TaxID=50990 RepID=A0A4Y7QEX3_9AGAM|nr:WD40 repeat-like protein [Rickenella mellea]